MNKTIISVALSAVMASPITALAQFTDVTAGAGVNVTEGRGAGWADYDKDGCLDLMIATGTAPLLFKSNCDGSFTDVSVTAGIPVVANSWGVAWGDYDNDGNLDAYVTNGDGALHNPLMRNNGDGTFTDVSATAFTAPAGSSAGATWGDIDADGDLDLFVANRFVGDLTDRLYVNNGDGTFTDIAGAAGVAGSSTRKTFSGAWFDYDSDGDQDLWLAVDFGDDVLYQNDGSGFFTNVSAIAGVSEPQHGMGISIGDMNADGCPDVFSSNNGQAPADNPDHGPSALYINNCDGTFTYASDDRGLLNRDVVEWGGNWVDFDNDGDLDLSVVSGGMLSPGEPNALYENDCGGDFCSLHNVTDAQGAGNGGASFGSAWADYDNDGDMDWFVVNVEGGPSALLRNDGPVANYLKVKLAGNGVTNNTYGVGAKIELFAGGLYQQRTIMAGVSYASSEELVAVFGLGLKAAADAVRVTWPNGTISQLANVTANQVITVNDGEIVVTTGTISGASYDPTGAPISALIRIFDSSNTEISSIRSDANGAYSAADLPVGLYSLSASKPGFRQSERSAAVDLQADQEVAVDLNLRVR